MVFSSELIHYIILLIIIADFIAGRILDVLNAGRWSTQIPEKLSGIFDPGQYSRSQEYQKAKFVFSMIASLFSFILILLMIVLNGFALVDGLVRYVTDDTVFQALLFFGIIGFAADILGLPFDVYATFVIEERFGFNRTTLKTFIADKIKGWALALIIGGSVLYLITWLYMYSGDYFWLASWVLISLVMLFFAMFYSRLILPLFNKLVPLEQGSLRDKIERFAHKTGFSLQDIYVINGSRRSSKANAYFTGIGRYKRIVLYDTLLADHSEEEIVSVLAHEVGHYKYHHNLYNILLSVFQTGLMLLILSFFVNNPALAEALGAKQGSFHMGVIAFAILFSPVSFLLGMVFNQISRKHEFKADSYAGIMYQPDALKQALIKLAEKNLSNLNPHPAYVFVHYSHPPLLARLTNLENARSMHDGS